jgi:GNAT superfamily N-acetyltransferase
MKTFPEFMIESQKVLNKISRNYSRRYRGVNIDVSHNPKTDSIRVNQLFVPPELRGQGIGTRVMKGLGKYADKTNNRITLTQNPDKGKKAKLQKFYKSHGFKPNKGKNRDFTTRDTHIRQPNRDT